MMKKQKSKKNDFVSASENNIHFHFINLISPFHQSFSIIDDEKYTFFS